MEHLQQHWETEQLNILFHIPKWLSNDGAKRMVQDYISCTVHSTKLIAEDSGDDALPAYKWADIVLTHLGTTGLAINTCKKLNKPLIFIAHNENKFSVISRDLSIGVINNSFHLPKYPNPSVVCHPMCVYKEGESDGKYITLINLNKNKGGEVLRRIANNMKDEQFLGVKGAYGKQIEQPKNVAILDHNDNIREILESTKILLMPSLTESWGRIAAEAIQMGVPVISTETNGIKECLEDAAWYVDRDDVDQWINAIQKIRGEKSLKYFRGLMNRRLYFLKEQAERDIVTFNKFIIQIHKSWQLKQSASNHSLDKKGRVRTLTAVS